MAQHPTPLGATTPALGGEREETRGVRSFKNRRVVSGPHATPTAMIIALFRSCRVPIAALLLTVEG